MNTIPSPSPTNAPAGILGRLGLATVLGFAMLVPLGLTVFYPPWSKVECERRQILYWSEQTKVDSSSFAGFDFLFSSDKWHREQTPPHPSSDTYFRSIEYQIAYPILFIEWLVLVVLGAVIYWRLSKKIFSPLVASIVPPVIHPPKTT